jgi:hypothetical protein
MRTEDTWFRFEDVVYASMLDEYDEPTGPGRLEVVRRSYRVVKHTPCGVQLDIGRFVKTAARKRYACPTEAEALESFLARKTRQLSILPAQASRVERAIALARARSAPQVADPSTLPELTES